LVGYQLNWFGTDICGANLHQKSNSMQPNNFPTTAAQIVLETITKGHSPCTVYVFGYRNSSISVSSILCAERNYTTSVPHFDLLVFTDKVLPNGASNIANAIAERSNKTISASVLLHKVTDLATAQPGQQWFFNEVLCRGQRLCIDKSAPPFIPTNSIPSRDYELERTYWLKCFAVANFNIQAAADSPQVALELCKIALLHAATVQIALGLIRVFLGYSPREFGLHYLLQLCGHFTDLPVQVFQQQTVVGIKRYKMFCAPPALLHHWIRLDASEQDFTVLLIACEAFLQLANALVEKELNR
jgi:hypothetical protein